MGRFLEAIGQPMAFGSFSNWWSLYRKHGADTRYLPRVVFATALTSLMTPLRMLERRLYQRRILATEIEVPPIFIIGHWRSGTTYLHQLLSQDARYGYVTLYQTLAPEIFFIGPWTIKSFVGLVAPNKRPGDNVHLFLDGPQEEEFALVNLSPHAFYHHWSFPRQQRWYFERYALFKDTPQPVIAAFKQVYRYVLQQATMNMGGKQLIIKNPTNSGRIPILLEMFPDAKFIHIYRNPYTVFRSTLKFYKSVHAMAQVQELSDDTLCEDILYFYEAILHKLFEDVHLIPGGNYAEVKFEDLEAQPITEMQRLYTQLNLGDFAAIQDQLKRYVENNASYRKNDHTYDPDFARLIEKRWAFALEKWNYNVPF